MRSIDELEYLSAAGLALAEAGPGEDLYRLTTELLAKVAPDSLVMAISYDQNDGSATVRAVAGPDHMQQKAREIVGDGIGRMFKVDDQAREILSEGKLVRLADGMHQLTFHTWPIELALRLEHELGVRAVFGQPFSRKGDFLGAVALASRSPSLAQPQLVEVLVQLAASAIQRRRAETRLRDSEHRFRMLAENSRDVIFRLRVQPRLGFEYVSPSATRLLGVSPQQLYPDPRRGCPSLYPEAWATEGVSCELPVEPLVAKWVRPDGSSVWIEQNFTAIRDSSGSIVAIEGIARDITKRREVEATLRETDRRKTDFIAMLSHELRNPLAVIGNGTHVLAEGTLGPDQVRRTLATIERQIVQLTHLIDDLLDITRITRGQIQLQRGPLDLDQLARAAVDDIRSGFPDARARLSLDLARDRVTILGDATRIRQVIDNLLHNAVKFTPTGGRASLSVDSTRNEAVVRVHNTGSTIPQDLIPNLFEPFVQADRSLDRRQGGLGLGLAIVKGLVEMHGGSVEVQSTEASGTTFTVHLPLNAPRAESSDVARSATLPVPRTTVLLIEDNSDAAEMMRMVLELRGHHVTVARTGREGLDEARTAPPDIVVCDIGLPEMDGYQVARAFRADHALRAIPMIALTGYATSEDIARAREAGFDRHVAKPPKVDVLAALIKDLAGNPRRDVFA